jgi:hypothetical protein
VYRYRKVDAYSLVAGGRTDGKSWREDLTTDCSITDCIDEAISENLFSTPDYFAMAEQIRNLEVVAKRVHGTCGVNNDKTLLKHSMELRSNLVTTRAESVLLRTFQPDMIQALGGVTRLEDPVRKLKSSVVRHAKWTSLFLPIYQRAQDALAGK